MASQFRWTSKSVDLLDSSGKLHHRKILDPDANAGILSGKEKNSQGRCSDSALGDGGIKVGHEDRDVDIGMVDKTNRKEDEGDGNEQRANNGLKFKRTALEITLTWTRCTSSQVTY